MTELTQSADIPGDKPPAPSELQELVSDSARFMESVMAVVSELVAVQNNTLELVEALGRELEAVTEELARRSGERVDGHAVTHPITLRRTAEARRL